MTNWPFQLMSSIHRQDITVSSSLCMFLFTWMSLCASAAVCVSVSLCVKASLWVKVLTVLFVFLVHWEVGTERVRWFNSDEHSWMQVKHKSTDVSKVIVFVYVRVFGLWLLPPPGDICPEPPLLCQAETDDGTPYKMVSKYACTFVCLAPECTPHPQTAYT